MSDLEPSSLRLAEVRALAASGAARAVREGARLSLAEVAADVGVSFQAVSQWERGEARPTGEPAQRYARLLRDLQKHGDGRRPASEAQS